MPGSAIPFQTYFPSFIMKKSYLNFLKSSCLLGCFLTFGNLTVSAQTEHRITNETANSLETFIEDTEGWSAGDVIVLASTGTYDVAGAISIHQDITIKADPDLASRPLLKFHDNGFVPSAEGLSMRFEGFDVDGLTTRVGENNEEVEHRASLLQYTDDNAFGAELIHFDDVHASGLNTGVELYYNQGKTYNSIIINNVIWHDISDWIFDPRMNALIDARITNSTFYNTGGFLKNPYFMNKDRLEKIDQHIVVDHNTFYNVLGPGFSDALLQVNDPSDGSVELAFTNNIVSTLRDPENARPFRINEAAGYFEIANNVFHSFNSAKDAGKWNLNEVAAAQANVVTENIINDDPAFGDPENGDFTIPENSQLVSAGTDGSALGAPRWAPERPDFEFGDRVHFVSNAEANSLELFIEDISKWNPRDTIVLASSGEYIVAGTIDLFQEVTIMGNPSLSVRPVVRFFDNGFRPKEDSISITIKGINFNGLKSDNLSFAPFLLRFDQAGFKNYKNITIEDAEIFNFSGVVQLYKNKGTQYESLSINNVVIHDITGFAIDPMLNFVHELSVTNSTFYGVGGFLKNVGNDNDGNLESPIQQSIVVDRNTFYNIASDNNALIQLNDGSDGSIDFTFSNNVVSTIAGPEFGRPFLINPEAGDFVFTNNAFYNFTSTRDEGAYNLATVEAQNNVTVTELNTDDPAFTNAEEFNFLLPLSSPLLTYGTNDGPIGDPRWVPEIGVTIRDLTAVVVEGDEVQLGADVIFAEGVDETVTWTVENNYAGTTGEATIDAATGLFTATSAGKVLVTATSNYSGAFSDQIEITIGERTLVQSIALVARDSEDVETTEIRTVAGELNLTATVLPGNADNKEIIWSVSDENLAAIENPTSTTARLVAKASGTVTVTATANDGSGVVGSIDIVIVNQIPLLDISVSTEDGATENVQLAVDETLQMTATLNPADTDTPEYTWTVDNNYNNTTGEATISEDGVLTGVAPGQVRVNATSDFRGGIRGRMVVTITEVTAIGPDIEIATVYPNPAGNFIYVNAASKVEVSVTTITGNVVKSGIVNGKGTFDLAGLQKGLYVVLIKSGKDVQTLKLMKE